MKPRLKLHTLLPFLLLVTFGLLVHSLPGQAANPCAGVNEAPQGTYAVPPATTVYYKVEDPAAAIDDSGKGDTPQAQIDKAFSTWNATNSAPGGTGTIFAPADADHPPTVFITADDYTGGYGATTSTPGSGTVTPLNKATITLHPGATITNGVDFYQPQQPGYDTVYLQVMLHEIGHLMGFGDYPKGTAPPPSSNPSALNIAGGVNGTDQTPPVTKPSDCDAQTAPKYDSAVTYTGDGSLGGGGGGTKGGHNPPPASPPPSGGTGVTCQNYYDPALEQYYQSCYPTG